MSERKRGDLLHKLASGIEGFDDITMGGLPEGRTTLLMGGPGCGKTVLALQILVNGALHQGTPGIFVAFEENARRVSANGEMFGWAMPELEKKEIYFVDACIRPGVVRSGAFDVTGLLAGLEAKARAMGARTIVFDAIDVLLSMLDDPAAERRELYRIHEWLARQELTGIFTTKVEDNHPSTAQRYGFMPFMADCAVLLSQRVTDRVAVRTVRVVKYRGSPHALNEVPFVIGPAGVEVGSSNGVHPESQPFEERISTGIERVDDMIGGGLYRGTNILITGSSGAGKSMLAGKFIEAACRRAERALFVSFDENSRDIARDLATVNIHLAPYLASGLLRMEAIRSEAASSEEHFMRVKRLIAEQEPRCVVVDPLSALARVGGGLAARAVAERLIYLCRNAGITLLFTSLLEGVDPHLETTTLHISTISDSWMQISYALLDGERNRALSIIKSRGSKHSSQLRELIFSDTGISLADPYTAGGEVLMGTLRMEKENGVPMDGRQPISARADHEERRV
ncbi:MAG: circadian clock protein KaiC [Chthoniobacter sp.]|uniref:circadian clock protein KaiC n=1 Tax=Chthoniobacter sp. TaxID=2510640 RepID=UPI0032AA59E3